VNGDNYEGAVLLEKVTNNFIFTQGMEDKELIGSNVNTSDMYSEGDRFESRRGHRLSSGLSCSSSVALSKPRQYLN
jgi:hypothetical protein